MRILRTSLLLAVAFIAIDIVRGDAPVVKTIDDFTLQDHLGARHSLSEWRDKRAVVVVFLGTECPLAKLYGARLAELAAEYGPKGVAFVGIDSNQQDSLLEIGHYVRTHRIDFPLLKDSSHRVADQFGATRTPEAFVLDAGGNVLYRGRIDDQFGIGYQRQREVVRDLANALDDVLAGKAVTTPVTEPVGCLIGRAKQTPPTGDVTYASQIVRLVDKHCVRCHREGQIAPFALTTYDDVTAWAETMREVMDDGRMPPWHANPKYGHFVNDAHMTVEEKQLFRQWVDNGMPEGNPADLPEPTTYADGWQIPTPDLVVSVPQPFNVPAKGTVEYQYFYADTKFDHDTWIRGAEVRPTNHAVVHHVLVFYLPPGQDEIRAEDPLFNAIAAFAPGMPSGLWPEGYARLVPAGSKLVFQMHYTPNGSEQIDQTEVGLVFADPSVEQKEVRMAVAANTDLRIPPQDGSFHIVAGYDFKHDAILHSVMPHMHYRGKAFRFTANYPDDKKEILLDVPQYDFNWQNVYTFTEPKRMPKGTVVMCDGYYDNSEENLSNPDPSKEVRWGDQTWEEMMLGVLIVSTPEDVARGEYPKIVRATADEYDVMFRFHPPSAADAVYLAGSFNGWKQDGQRMDGPDDDGYYHATLRLAPGRHEYKFVINGKEWMSDPDNPDSSGAFSNSVVRVRSN
jgi:peroxiredoxin